jgi:hypothetical protein
MTLLPAPGCPGGCVAASSPAGIHGAGGRHPPGLLPFIHGCHIMGGMERDKPTTQLKQLHTLIEQVEVTTKSLGGQLPGAFLASVMSGYDPREVDSPLFTLVKKISFRDLEGGENFPTPEEWLAVSEEILSGGYERARVPVEQSQRAAEKLMEFLHAKMKAVELSGQVETVVKVEPLTGEELERFRERFNRDN